MCHSVGSLSGRGKVSSERDLRGCGAMNTGLGRDGKLGDCFVPMLLESTIGS